jgi:hypothetical protein
MMIVRVNATVLFSDSFTYADGGVVSNAAGVWINNSGTAGSMISTGGVLVVSISRSEDIAHQFASTIASNGPITALYASMKVTFTQLPSQGGTYFAHFNGDAITAFKARVWAATTNILTSSVAPAGSFYLGVGNITPATATPIGPANGQVQTLLTTNTTYAVVVRYVLATGISTLWVDTNPTTLDEAIGGATADDAPALGNINYYGFRQASGEGTIVIDDLKIGTQFADVAGANTAPTVSSISNEAIPQDGNTGALPFTVGDPESDPATLTVTKASTNTTLVPLTGIVINNGDGTNRTVTVTPAAGEQGQTLITLTVSDGVNTAQSSFVVTVGAPSISVIPNQITISNVPTAAIHFTVSDAETSAGSLTVFASASNPTLLPPANVVLGGGGADRTITLTPEADQIGVSTITVSVTDGINTNSSTFRLSVTPLLGVLLSDDFNYSSFLLPNGLFQADGSPWLHASGTSYELQVTNGVCYMNSALGEDLAAQLTNSPYGSSNGIVFYSGFTLKCTTLPTQAGANSYFAHFKDSQTGTTFRAKVFAETNNAAAGKFRVGVANNGNVSTQFPQDLEVGVTYAVVTRYASGIGEAVLWVNPVSESSPSITGTDSLQTSPVGHYGLRQDSGFGVIELGKLKVATSFAEVVTQTAPAPEPLQFQLFGSDLVLSWTNTAFTLQASPLVSGTFTNITGASSPHTNPVTSSQGYFRLHYP